VILGAIEIGLRSTRLSVSDVGSRSSRRLITRDHRLSARLASAERLGALVMAESEAARDAGSERVEVFASPELRGSRLIRLVERFAEASGTGPVRLPSRRERSAAAFLGGTRSLVDEPDPVGVARIDEDAIGIAVGTPGGPPEWIGTRPVGAVAMTRRARFFDPPLPAQIEAAVSGAGRAMASLAPPFSERLLVSSPLAAVVARLAGTRPGARELRRGLGSIYGQTADDIAAWFGVGSGLARQLPGVLVGHLALAEALDRRVEPAACDHVAGRYWLDLLPAAAEGGGR